MFSKNAVIIVSVIVLIVVNLIALTVAKINNRSSFGMSPFVIAMVAPLQKSVTGIIHFSRDMWCTYFNLISTAKKNKELKRRIAQQLQKNNRYKEIEQTNNRLRKLLNYQKSMPNPVITAQVIARDPASWFETLMIDKGKIHGVIKGLPVVTFEGIAGQIIEVYSNYSKVLLIIDRNSSVDALVQRTRARGIIQGDFKRRCVLKYVLRKDDVIGGDTVVSSGLDGVFPKGLFLGHISEITKPDAGIFQEVVVIPFVNFEKLEEVLVLLIPDKHKIKKDKVKKE